MESLFSKLSLYDLLTMVIPGGVLLYIFTVSVGIHSPCNISTIEWIFIAALSYLLGLINHQLTALMWSPFRNNPIMLTKSHECILAQFEKGKTACPYCPIFKYAIISLVCVPVFGLLWYNCNCWFLVVGIVVMCCIVSLCYWWNCRANTKVETNICDTYYKAYYKVMKNRYNNDISIMEGQVAFMQSMLLPLILLTLVVAYGSDGQWSCPCAVISVMAVFIISIMKTIYARQMKIYNRIWEDDKYLKNEKNN